MSREVFGTVVLFIIFICLIIGLCTCVLRITKIRAGLITRMRSLSGDRQVNISVVHEPKQHFKHFKPELDPPPKYWEVIEKPHIYLKSS